MLWILIALFFMVAGGFAALLSQSPFLAKVISSLSLITGVLIGFIPVISVLIHGEPLQLRLPWSLPLGTFYLYMDTLSAFFSLPLLGLSALSAIYGWGYSTSNAKTPFNCFCFSLLVASMWLVLLARNAMLFLIVWELMALFSFFLVVDEHEKEEVRHAGWVYLVATHIGTAFLLVLFFFLSIGANSLDFDSFTLTKELSTLAFILAVIGFGTKAGFMPFHVWLPLAHSSAPSFVSAIMSGVMIKTGIYGLLRILPFLGTPPPLWGWILLACGSLSGILGALLALTQNDVKKLLAYSSIENMGIITLGLGMGLLGISHHQPIIAALGIGGALLHVINHALFKGLLFMGAGAIYHSTHLRQMDKLGGLYKQMPRTGLCFLVGTLAISSLPPFNGFVSEFLIFLASLAGTQTSFNGSTLFGLFSMGSIALIGGLALCCFTRAFGILFLGMPRTANAARAHEVNPLMRGPLFILAILCLLVGFLSPLIVTKLIPSLCVAFGGTLLEQKEALQSASSLKMVLLGSTLFFFLITLFATLRHYLLKSRVVTQEVTWDCAYIHPREKMQYTGSSFSEPLSHFFRWILRYKYSSKIPRHFFPSRGTFSTTSVDFAEECGYKPLFKSIRWFLERMRWLQSGNVQLYILYIALTLLILLLWKT